MTSEDAISRQAVIDSLHSKFVDGFDSDRWWNSMSVLYAINKVPSVSTEKTGRWIEERTYMECPNCYDIWHYEENQTERFKFCPTCGKRFK